MLRPKKVSPYIIHSADYIFFRSFEINKEYPQSKFWGKNKQINMYTPSIIPQFCYIYPFHYQSVFMRNCCQTHFERHFDYLPLNILLLPKDQIIIFYLLLLQLALCRVAAQKVSPYIIHSADYIFFRSFEINKEYPQSKFWSKNKQIGIPLHIPVLL